MLISVSIMAQETKVHPVQIHDAGATIGQILEWDGAKWVAADNSSGTDDQTISLNGNILSLEDGGTVDLSVFLDNTDDQQLSLSSNTLTLEDGGTVDLSTYLDNTDAQTVSYNSSTGVISISNGNSTTIEIGELWTSEALTVASAGASITIAGSIPASDTESVLVSRNGLVQRIGAGSADVSISASTVTFNQRNLEVGEIIYIKYPND